MPGHDLDEDARVTERHLPGRVMDAHDEAIEALGRLPGEVVQHPLGQRAVGLVAETNELAALRVDVPSRSPQKDAFGARGLRLLPQPFTRGKRI